MKLLTLIIISLMILSVQLMSVTATQSGTADTIVSQQDKVKVIITFKDKPKTAADHLFNIMGIPQQDPKEKIKDKIKTGGQLKHEFTTTDSVSATITQDLLDELKADPSIAYIEEDRKVYAFLDQSVPLIKADLAWDQQMDDTGLKGSGTTVCVIDTGIDYTHDDLGNCTLWNLSGNVESYNLESLHPYDDNTTVEWIINRTGFTNISVHFVNISLEKDYDYIQIRDSEDNLITEYTGDSDAVWSPSVTGDTIKVRLIADLYENESGFVIDTILNGTATHSWNSCNKVIYGWNFAGDYWNPIDNNDHGTHVAGIIAADGTVTGVAPDTKLIAMKVLGRDGSGYDSDVMAGIDWCISNASTYNISVISMSLGGETKYSSYCDGSLPTYASYIDSAVSNNISVIIATGNDANYTGISVPACLENATRVGATYDANVGSEGFSSCSDASTFTDMITCYTDRALNFKDMLLAPGGATYSTSLGDGYITHHGTSMATPHVSGATAILVQAYKDRFGTRPAPAYIEYVLNKTGKSIFDSQTGLNFSRIDILSAVLYINAPPNITDIYNNITENNSQTITIDETDSISFNLTVSAQVNYTWKKNGTIVWADQPSWTFDTTYDDSGFWTVEVTAENDNGTRRTHWNVTINNVNRPPIITLISNISMDVQNQTTINISANISDPDNDTLTITTDDPGNITVENYTLIFHYTENVTNKPVTITVNDSDLTANTTIYINITDTLINITDTYNNVTGDSSSALAIDETDSVFFNISTDVSVNYTWYLNGTEVGDNSDNYTLSTGFDDAGTKNISVNVSTNYSYNIFRWTVEILNKNRPPIITAISNITMELQSQTTINISANISDPDNDILTITTDDPGNITIDNHTLIFNYTQIITDKQITITVNDSDMTTNKTIYLNITDKTPPALTFISPANKTYNTTDLNISIDSDELLDWCAYSLNDQPNMTMDCTENKNITAIENNNNLTLWANDTDGNLNHTNIFFSVDTIRPNFTVTAFNYTTDNYLYINLSISETPDTCILDWSGENITMNKTEDQCSTNKTLINPGVYNYTIYVNDTLGNTNSSDNLQAEIYYCFGSVTDWSSCVSSKKTRTYIYRNCSRYIEQESCSSSSGGGSYFTALPPEETNDTLNETLTDITYDRVDDTETDIFQNDTALIENKTQEELINNDGTKKTEDNKVGTHTISGDEDKDLENIDGGLLGIKMLDDILFENSLVSKIKDRLDIDSTDDRTFNYLMLLFIMIIVLAVIGISYNYNKSKNKKQKNNKKNKNPKQSSPTSTIKEIDNIEPNLKPI